MGNVATWAFCNTCFLQTPRLRPSHLGNLVDDSRGDATVTLSVRRRAEAAAEAEAAAAAQEGQGKAAGGGQHATKDGFEDEKGIDRLRQDTTASSVDTNAVLLAAAAEARPVQRWAIKIQTHPDFEMVSLGL